MEMNICFIYTVSVCATTLGSTVAVWDTFVVLPLITVISASHALCCNLTCFIRKLRIKLVTEISYQLYLHSL